MALQLQVFAGGNDKNASLARISSPQCKERVGTGPKESDRRRNGITSAPPAHRRATPYWRGAIAPGAARTALIANAIIEATSEIFAGTTIVLPCRAISPN
jgi:hypothetical protein